MDTTVQINTLWVLICTALVFFMQAGFCCLESGLSRSKNSINVAIKNVADLCIAGVLFWIFGYALMFGDSWAGLVGTTEFLFSDSTESKWPSTVFLFQLVFCGTAMTIASGAVAERMRFRSYLILATLICGVIYPVFGHWAWGGLAVGQTTGWLGKLGFIDFAGSTVVHCIGAWSALAAIIILGARTGKFEKGKPPRVFRGHNIPMATLGVFILWLGWFGFNGGSTLALDGSVPKILVNTFLVATFGGVTALAWQTFLGKLVSVESVLNGVLAGLVGVTASCHLVSIPSAMIIGIVASIIVQLATPFMEKRLKLDDVVGAIPVHGCAGAWGTVAVALFAPVSSFSAGFTRWDQLLVQLCGVGVCFLWAFGVCWIGLTVVRKFVSLRVMADEEHVGLNVAEHGAATEFQDLLGAMDAHIQGDMSARVPIDDLTDAGLIAAQYNRVLDSVEAKTEEVHQANIELSAANKEAIAAQKQLTHKMEELEEFNDLAVGRELRMVDLKSEINELLDQQGQAERYQVDDTIEQSEGSVEAISMALASISFADGDIERESEFKEESASVNE